MLDKLLESPHTLNSGKKGFTVLPEIFPVRAPVYLGQDGGPLGLCEGVNERITYAGGEL